MITKVENNEESQNYVELAKILDELKRIQKDLESHKKDINKTKDKFEELNKQIQWSKLEKKNKENIQKTFDKLAKNLEKNMEENYLRAEFNKIINPLEQFIQKDLADLQQNIQQNNKQRRNPKRPLGVNEWIYIAANKINDIAKNWDDNILADLASKGIARCLS